MRRLGASGCVRVDVRIVSATNEDLETLDRFRRDLYWRLNVLRIDIPPLRERKGDLPAIVDHLLGRIARETRSPLRGITREALDRLARHPWPGNVRELENALRRAWAMSNADVLGVEDFHFLRIVPPPRTAVVDLDTQLRDAVERHSHLGNSELARKLGISRKTLWRHKKRWGMV